MFQKKWRQLRRRASSLFSQDSSKKRSAAYCQWRHQFVANRLRLGVWIAIAAELFLWATEVFLEAPLMRLSEQARFDISFSEAMDDLQSVGIAIVCLLVFQQLLNHPHFNRLPIKLLPVFTFIVLVVGSALYQPSVIQQLDSDVVIDIAIVFWCQAILVPVQWRSHLLAQVLSVSFIFGTWFVARVSGSDPIALPFAWLDMTWGALYCLLVIVSANVMVSYSEQLSWREFSLREQIELSLKTVSEDLQRPILNNQQLLKKLQPSVTKPSGGDRSIHIPNQTVQKLLDNSDCQLSLLNGLLAAADYRD